jgi:hypothetical protein
MRSLLILIVALLLASSGTARAFMAEWLDGPWQIVADPSDQGRAANWGSPTQFPQAKSQPTRVPGNIFDAISVSQWPDRKNQLAWYRLDFTPTFPVVQPGDHLYLRFAGVNRKSEVWLNDISLGAHEGAESPFEFDVTSAIAWGKTNTLIVRVWSDWFGGINNHVKLVTQPAVRIVDIFAQPDMKKSDIDVDINVENNTGADQQIALEAGCSEWKPKWIPESEVFQKRLTVTAPAGESTSRITLLVPRARIWDLDHPFLYIVGANLDWKSTGGLRHDSASCRVGFRDFRNVDGFFYLNGKRIFLRSLHGGGHFDPISVWATPSSMSSYLGRQFPNLKKAGFNMMRFLQSTPLTEQLDQADEMGFLIYAENETSWHVGDPNQFGGTISAMVRRDRNHPSLVMWGLLNETEAGPVYDKAKASLPLVRNFDPTRYVELSSGRFDHDAKTGSGSNPGSATWDVYLGGEDPTQPTDTGTMPEDLGSFRTQMGDCHPYPFYPLSWSTLMAFAHLSQNAKPVFVSETGMGSSYNGVNEVTKLDQAGAPKDAFAYTWARPMAAGLERTWKTYDLAGTYPTPGDMMADSSISSAIQRAEIFSALRGNPKVAGYSLTSIYDAGGAGEGVMDTFGAFKAGHLQALQDGWAPLRWCLLINPTHIYADQPLHIFASLATEDRLSPGGYPVTFSIRAGSQVVWTRRCTVTIPTGGPMAYSVLDEDVTVPNLTDGTYQLTASLNGRPNAAAPTVTFYVTKRESVPKLAGPLILAGVSGPVRDFLTAQGAAVQDYDPNQAAGKNVIVIGDGFKSDAAGWRALYARAARGAHLVFLANSVFAAPSDALHWLALPNRGILATNPEWLYHRDYVAKPNPLWTGLQTKLMFPEFFGPMLAHVAFINDIVPPPDVAALGIYSTANLDGHFEDHDGLALGTYPFHAGHLTLCAFNLLGNIGQPAPDRLLVNMILAAQADAAAPVAAPPDLEAELDKLNIR